MKFHQLPVGAGFVWRGASWRKVAPLMAASEGDKPQQQLVPRSAEVTRLAGDAAMADATPELPASIAGNLFETATWECIDHCRTAIARLDPPLTDPQRSELTAAIERAAQQMLSRIATRSGTG